MNWIGQVYLGEGSSRAIQEKIAEGNCYVSSRRRLVEGEQEDHAWLSRMIPLLQEVTEDKALPVI